MPTTLLADAVSTTGLTKSFGDRTVVDHLDLSIPSGSVCGFVGPNGAGKTTTIRMLLGLIRPTEGAGTVLGGDLHDPSSYLSRVGALIEAPAFYPQLSGRDNLRALATLGQIRPGVIGGVLERVGLGERSGDRYRNFSLGMKQRLGIAAALLAAPDLLVLDEPTNGLDPAGILEMRELIRSLADDGITVFISSHLLSEIEFICDHLVMIRSGRSVFQGRVTDLRESQGSDIVVRPERDEQCGELAAVLQGAGYLADIDDDHHSVVVRCGSDRAADVNRVAMGAGIALTHLAVRERSLEEAFFALTGTHTGEDRQTATLGEIG
ncbi:MAG TPA: ATP-binding cassette domain-containing protein [Acidimicrobiales bacterium]|nr:ATP-binding cassette domain-containing protein [Acidimicrobiales bacterium]